MEVNKLTTILIFGAIVGILIFLFTFSISKKIGKFYLAPVVTSTIALFIILYSIFKIGGFEGMGYGLLGMCILAVAVIGSLILLFVVKKVDKKKFNNLDKTIIIFVPILLFALIAGTISFSEDYWIIAEGTTVIDENSSDSYYTISTISEGRKQVHIQLGESYQGKQLQIENVKTIGNTEVLLKITDGGEFQKSPFIKIGIDTIVEPFVVKTTDGEVILPIFNAD